MSSVSSFALCCARTAAIADALGAAHLHPGRNAIIIDFGTATTLEVLTADREYLGGIILPGLRIAMEALEKNTARLPTVEIAPPGSVIGRSTVESIQSGLYFGTRAMVSGLVRDIKSETFGTDPVVVIGTAALRVCSSGNRFSTHTQKPQNFANRFSLRVPRALR